MNKSVLFILIIALFVFGSCSKVEDPDISGAPVFYVDGLKNGTEFEFEAGEHDVYLYTNNHHHNDSTKVFVSSFSNMLTNEALKISVFSEASSNLEQCTPKSANYTYFTPATNAIQFFAELTNGEARAYKWEFDGGITSTEENPIIYFPTATQKSHVNVCLEVEFMNGTKHSTCNEVNLPHSGCYSDFKVFVGPSYSLIFASAPEGTPPFTYEWKLKHLNIECPYETFLVTFQSYNNLNIEEVELEITDANGCKSELQRSIYLGGPNTKLANFRYAFADSLNTSVPLNKSTIIEYTSASGEVYSTEFAPPSAEQKFELSNQHSYEVNEHGMPTYLFDIDFSCDLYSETGQKIELRNCAGKVAFAY